MKQGTLFRVEGLRKISRFRGPWGFLHNFYVESDGTHVEGEYQSDKCANPADVERFVGLSPRAAKELGQSVVCRPDWKPLVRVAKMRARVLRKFEDHRSLRERLLSTEDWILEEGNKHGDTFWGTVDGIGENVHGKILMEVREILR